MEKAVNYLSWKSTFAGSCINNTAGNDYIKAVQEIPETEDKKCSLA